MFHGRSEGNIPGIPLDDTMRPGLNRGKIILYIAFTLVMLPFFGLLLLLLSYGAFRDFGDWSAVSIVCRFALAILVGGFIYSGITTLIDTRRKCRHGVRGADSNSNLCAKCIEDAAESERQRQEADESKLAREAALMAAQIREAQALRQKRYEEHLRSIRLPNYLRSMDPHKFESLVLEVYHRKGWRVEPTRASGDGGVDGFLRKDGKLCLLQCKRVDSVGEPVFRDLFGAMHHYEADSAVLVTTGNVSRQARTWLHGKPIEVVELDDLAKMVRETHPEHEVVPVRWRP